MVGTRERGQRERGLDSHPTVRRLGGHAGWRQSQAQLCGQGVERPHAFGKLHDQVLPLGETCARSNTCTRKDYGVRRVAEEPGEGIGYG
jgi:hypothetical protein